jgi:hypothetical protein
MPKKISIDAPSLGQLRGFLADMDVDLGCRPFVRKKGDRFSVIGVADDAQLGRLAERSLARSADDVRVEVLEELPSSEERLRMVKSRSSIRRDGLPRGLGRKE